MNNSHWAVHLHDPNSEEALAHRRQVLDAAYRPVGRDRRSAIISLCKGRRVLDIGCVDHDSEHVGQEGTWLHADIARVADSLIGVDIVEAGVKSMNELGYRAVVADITDSTDPLAEFAPFDVVIAADVIEHLDHPVALLTNTRTLLRPGGYLVLTTPNPYGVGRLRASQLNKVFENVDHTVFLFPSGVAEMCDRANMRLESYWSTGHLSMWRLGVHSLRHLLLLPKRRNLPRKYISLLEVMAYATRRRQLMGESLSFILRCP
jgi:2-polyprenyl-3-methyl-5-hydroxy-6-metoxy-1,4-benzoquinol methylase